MPCWLEIVDCVLRPTRPDLARCLALREHHLEARASAAEDRARAIANCVQRINDARAVIFATNDGVVGARMTDLEREWRWLSRSDPDAGLMDLWARIAPPSWIDRKRWRDSAIGDRLDAAIALAADAENVEAAEGAIRELRARGAKIGPCIRWRFFEEDREIVRALFEAPIETDREKVERAHRIEARVLAAALARFPERPCLARDIAHAAFVDSVWSASAIGPSPVAPLHSLWKTGYVLAAADSSGVVVEITSRVR